MMGKTFITTHLQVNADAVTPQEAWDELQALYAGAFGVDPDALIGTFYRADGFKFLNCNPDTITALFKMSSVEYAEFISMEEGAFEPDIISGKLMGMIPHESGGYLLFGWVHA